MLVLGVDPGTAITGYALVKGEREDISLIECGVLTTPAGMPLDRRLLMLYDGMKRIVVSFRPDVMAIEDVFFGRNVSTAIAVSQGRGVVLLAAAQEGIPVYSYKPAEIKMALSGYGGARKAQIQSMVQMLLGLDAPPRPDDAADAVAVAICHLQVARYRALTEAESSR